MLNISIFWSWRLINSRLTRLDLSSNRLSVIPNTLLRQTPHIEELILDNNNIETIVFEVIIVETFKLGDIP